VALHCIKHWVVISIKDSGLSQITVTQYGTTVVPPKKLWGLSHNKRCVHRDENYV